MPKVGYRFHPTEQELLEYYLFNKITENPILNDDDDDPVKVCDLYGDQEPWDIWILYGGNDLLKDEVLYFFTRLKKLTPKGSRFNRKIGSGVWQGEDGAKSISAGGDSDRILGFKKRFRYENSNRPEEHGGWIMHEYTISSSLLGAKYSHKSMDYVLCSIKKKESAPQKDEASVGEKQRMLKQVGERGESRRSVSGEKRKLKQIIRPSNNEDQEDNGIQNKRVKTAQETVLIQPIAIKVPCANNLAEVVESEAVTERYCNRFDVRGLFSTIHQSSEGYDSIEYPLPEDGECVQSKPLMIDHEESLQVIEYEAETEAETETKPLVEFDDILLNIDFDFDPDLTFPDFY